MCTLCKLRKQRAARGDTSPITFAEVINEVLAEARALDQQRAEAAAPKVNPTPPSYAEVELGHLQAQVNAANAEAVFKLAQSMKWLRDAGFDRQADMTAALLNRMLPPLPLPADTEKAEPVDGAGYNEPTQAEMPANLAAKKTANLVNALRGMGFSVILTPL